MLSIAAALKDRTCAINTLCLVVLARKNQKSNKESEGLKSLEA
jgi:hypothetical protein